MSRRASDKCQREKRKTINGDDLLWAMSTLGFEEYIEPLKIYLAKFREVRHKLRPLAFSTIGRRNKSVLPETIERGNFI